MKAAFYDFDGTLSSSNVVTRYLYFARRCPSPVESFYRTTVGVGGVPLWLLIDARSRAAFNRQFFGLYAGMPESWLREQAAGLFEQETRPKIYAGSAELLERDRQVRRERAPTDAAFQPEHRKDLRLPIPPWD